ncbi:MAG TPA: DivIVA domain-containing protein [Solirubrobacterales bacterium]
MAADERQAAAASAAQRREMQQRITEIRKASFESARKGYDKAQVRHYLEAVADWLEGLGLGDADRGEMRRELAWVGERTSDILTQAEETANELREQGQSEASKLRSEAQNASDRLRVEADEESRRVRMEAATEAEETVAAAERKAEAIIEDANRRRRDLQALIGDLLVRRDEIVADGVRLADELTELFATTMDVPESEVTGDASGEESGDDSGDDYAGDGEDPRRARRFDPAALEETGDRYDEDGVRIPLGDDEEEGPPPRASWPGETIESDAIPDPQGTEGAPAEDPDTEEQKSTR